MFLKYIVCARALSLFLRTWIARRMATQWEMMNDWKIENESNEIKRNAHTYWDSNEMSIRINHALNNIEWKRVEKNMNECSKILKENATHSIGVCCCRSLRTCPCLNGFLILDYIIIQQFIVR